jgi:tRNA U34 2-thiouridine synthase MnmA/TrmU
MQQREIVMDSVSLENVTLKNSLVITIVKFICLNCDLGEFIANKPGVFVDVSGKVVGNHNGAHLFTLGERAKISGQPFP